MIDAAGVLTVLAAIAGMEAVSYLMHRFVMHGFGIGVHRSHHQWNEGGWERNDLYPLSFSSLAIAAFALGTSMPAPRLVQVGIGMTLYGASYLFVHELYVHQRVGRWRGRVPRHPVLERLKAAHRVHHLYGGEPFGMLLPVVPRHLRAKAAKTPRDPFVTSPTHPVG